MYVFKIFFYTFMTLLIGCPVMADDNITMDNFSETTNNIYTEAQNYWATAQPTINAMTGMEGISDLDIQGSEAFLQRIFKTSNPPDKKYALDCGAGIGRITQNLLFKYFNKVDLVEQNENFVTAAHKNFGENNTQLGTVYNSALQHFKPQRKYDVIWIQWILQYLKDSDVVNVFQTLAQALQPNGVLVVKENIQEEVTYNSGNISVTRNLKLMQKLFEAAGLQQLIKFEISDGLPYLHIFGLIPLRKNTDEVKSKLS